MIEKKELRIGNFLQDNRGNLCIVEGLNKNVGEDNIIAYSKSGVCVHPLKLIPLSEHWIIKFGLDEDNYSSGYVGKKVISDDFKATDFCIVKPFKFGRWQNYYCFPLLKHQVVKLEYVHQLQNLFFSLTGQELKYPKKGLNESES